MSMTTELAKRMKAAALKANASDDWGCDGDNFHDVATTGNVLALVEALEAAEKRNAELENDCRTYESTVKNLLERAGSAESACAEAARILESGERIALTRAVNILLTGVAVESE